MDILLYLTALLETRKSVGIVGLGTLYKKKSPGKYDVEKHAFVPPSYTLAFTIELLEQEELANYISKERNITTDSANYYIGEFAEKIQAQLADHQEADFTPIGTLKLNNDEIVLIPNEDHNLGFEFFGLPTLNDLSTETNQEIILSVDNTEVGDTPSIEEEVKLEIDLAETMIKIDHDDTNSESVNENDKGPDLEAVIEENKLVEENPGLETTEPTHLTYDEQPVYDEITELETPIDKEENETIVGTEVNEKTTGTIEKPMVTSIEVYDYLDDDDDEDESRPGKFFRILIRIIIILIIVTITGALAYFFFPSWFDSKIYNDYSEQPQTNEAVSIQPIDSLKPDSLKLKDSLTKNNDLVSLVKDTSSNKVSSAITYEVIGSAERTQKRIDYVISSMKKKGIIAKPLQNVPGKLVKISLGSFVDYNLAKKYQDSLKIKLKNPQIYIQFIKPKK